HRQIDGGAPTMPLMVVRKHFAAGLQQQREARSAPLRGKYPGYVEEQTLMRVERQTQENSAQGRLFTWSKAAERLRRGRNSRNRTAARGLRSQRSSPSCHPSRLACPDASSEGCD